MSPELERPVRFGCFLLLVPEYLFIQCERLKKRTTYRQYVDVLMCVHFNILTLGSPSLVFFSRLMLVAKKKYVCARLLSEVVGWLFLSNEKHEVVCIRVLYAHRYDLYCSALCWGFSFPSARMRPANSFMLRKKPFLFFDLPTFPVQRKKWDLFLNTISVGLQCLTRGFELCVRGFQIFF